MHVRSLVVTRYGPMAPFEDEHLPAFTVIHGPNEQGKTLLIDALLRLLFKKKLKRSSLKHFGNLGRVNETPEGYVVLATHAEEVKLGEDDTLSDVSKIAITPEDFRNVFLIRDSDLSVRDEREFYEGITEKLTGIRSSEIDRLLKVIQRMGRLRSITPESALANSVENDKIADRVKAARALVRDLDAARDELTQAGFDELVQELVGVRDARAQRERERDRYRAAERRARFQKARAVVNEVSALDARLEKTKHLDAATVKQWRSLSVEQKSLTQDITRDERAAEKLDRDIKGWAGEATKLGRRTQGLATRLRDIESALKTQVDAYQHDRADFRRDDSQVGMNRKVFYASIALVLAAVVAVALSPTTLTFSVAGGAVAICAFLGISVLRTARKRTMLLFRAEKLCAEAARYGIDVSTVNEMASAIGDAEREFAELSAEADVKRAEVTAARRDRERIDKSTGTRRHRVTEIDGAISGLRARTDIASLDALEVVVDDRARAAASVQAKMELLCSLAPVPTRAEATILSQLETYDAEIRRALTDVVPGDTADDPDAAARLDRQIKELREREREISANISDGNRRLHAIEVKAASLGVLEEPPRCRTILELDHVREGIESFCERIAHEQALAQEAIRIFQEIDDEERQRVGDLFGVDSSVSRLFREFTDGRYRLVTYEPEQNQVYVERVDGLRMRATALSGGAFDQLYLAIRISIAERLLPETGGFFIMDDPFIKADRKRLLRLMRTLERLVERGWQILYFTAKDEVVEALHDGIDAGRIKRIDLGQSLFSPTPKSTPTLWGAQMD